jgi:protease-4
MPQKKEKIWVKMTNKFKNLNIFSKKSEKIQKYASSIQSNDYNTISFVEKLLHDVTKWKFIAIGLLLIIGLLFFKSGNKNAVNTYKNFIAVIEIDGVIETDSYRTEILDKLVENKSLKGVFLKINSPGGTITGSEILYNEIKRLREVVPVYSLIYDLGASGGYMTALGSTQIFAHESSITGSIGVLMQSLEVEDLANKIGARMRTYRSSQYKGQPDSFKKATPEIDEYMRETIEKNHNFFSQIVVSERKIPAEQMLNIANGKIFMGKEAVALQLIDGIANEQMVKKMLEEKAGKYDFVEVSLKKDEKTGIVSQIIDDILNGKKESLYGAKVMAVMKL